jgi:amino-acid N-acetyltransferase
MSRVVTWKLAEQHVDAVVALEEACTAMYQQKGITQAKPRTLREIVQLTKRHNVHVAEVENQVIGYVAWRDESPGVAYIEELSVHPDHQKKGIGKHLLELVRAEAAKLKLEDILLRTYSAAPWAAAFWKKNGFVPLDDKANEKVRQWKADQPDPITEPGQAVLVGRV